MKLYLSSYWLVTHFHRFIVKWASSGGAVWSAQDVHFHPQKSETEERERKVHNGGGGGGVLQKTRL